MALSFNNTQDLVNRDQDFVGNGVLKTTDFPLAFPELPDMTFGAGEGIAWVNGSRVANDATPELLTVAAADAEPRIDIVQVGFDAAGNSPVLAVKKGIANRMRMRVASSCMLSAWQLTRPRLLRVTSRTAACWFR